jgi:lysophospholipase L1-like esterase
MGSRALLMLIVLFHSAICAAKTYKCSDNYYGDEPINTDCEEINIDGNGLETTNASKIIRQQRGDVINLSNIPQPPQHTSIRTSSPQKVPMPFFINKANNYFEVGNEQDFSRFMSRWNTLDAPIKILHIGDSHVQSGIGPQVSSHVLQNERKAIIYRSKGLNGATLQEVDKVLNLERELRDFNPDLVVLDFGSNELHNRHLALPSSLEGAMEKAISRIRAIQPDVVIVFAAPQDMKVKNQHTVSVQDYIINMRRIALNNRCLLWDWHRVAGGVGAMKSWYTNGLARADFVHLAAKGYRIKGELFANALLNTIKQYRH